MEKRAQTLEDIGLDGYEVAVFELNNFARMVRNAIEYAGQLPK